MEKQVNDLVDKAWARYKDLKASQRLLIAVGGMPGSGKTTLATTVVNKLNERYRTSSPAVSSGSSSPVAVMVPMDGYHLSRAQLDALPDSANAHARRGAAFTFDAPGFLTLVRQLRAPLTPESRTIRAPSFDHALKDPVADDISVGTGARVVVFEGNYVCLNVGAWGEAAALMDERWFSSVDEKVARRRLVARHVRAGIAQNEEEAGRRADQNDLVNGREINEKRVQCDEVVTSVEDDGWSPEALGVGEQ